MKLNWISIISSVYLLNKTNWIYITIQLNIIFQPIDTFYLLMTGKYMIGNLKTPPLALATFCWFLLKSWKTWGSTVAFQFMSSSLLANIPNYLPAQVAPGSGIKIIYLGLSIGLGLGLGLAGLSFFLIGLGLFMWTRQRVAEGGHVHHISVLGTMWR